MLDITSIPHLRVQRSRASLPVPKTGQKSLVIFNVSNSSEIGHIMSQHKMIVHYNKYQKYYMESKYKRRIFNRQIIENFYNERYQYLEQIAKIYPSLRMELTIQKSTSMLITDMSIWNKIYFENLRNSFSYMQRCEEYIGIVKDFVRNPEFSEFGTKAMIIDLEKWQNYDGVLGNFKYLNSPLLIFYYMIWKNPAAFKAIGDVNIVFLSSKGMLRVNPALIDRDSFRAFRIELDKLNKIINWDNIDKDVHKLELGSSLSQRMKTQFNFTGDEPEAEKVIDDKVDEIVDKVDSEDEEETEEKSQKEIDAALNDKELINKIASSIKQNNVTKVTLTKRDEELRDKQRQIKLENSTVGEILNKKKAVIESFKVDAPTINENVKNIRFANFEKSYNENYLKSDMMNSIMAMNDAEIPVFVRNVKVENTSDAMTFKETYTVELEDAHRVRHTLKFDMPIFVDDKFLYLNGNKKIINKQLFLKPIIKTKENEVQVVTNYNKIFLHRHGSKLSPKTEKLRKTLIDSNYIRRGNNMNSNNKYKTTIEYDEVGKYFSVIKFGKTEFHFNQDKALEIAKNLNIKVPEDKMLVGFIERKTPIFVDHSTQMIGEVDLVDYIMNAAPATVKTQYDSTTTGKKFLYSRATVMAKQVPLVLLLGYCEGLTTVLRKAEIKHHFTEKRPKLTANEGMVQFEDGYLVYDKYPFANSLLMNAFSDIPTKGFKYEEMDGKDAYSVIFDVMFNQRNLASAFDNFYDFMIDPITREVLEDLDYPTKFVEVMLFANDLLSDNSFVNENDMSLYRVRSNELVNVFLYKAIVDAYGDYRRTAYNNNPKKISIRKDHVIKNLLMAQTVEDYSILNPIVEVEKSRVISPKGPSGLNLAQAYTLDKRGYDPTMLGTIAISTSPDANVGVVRQLTMEPNINGPRGYIDVKIDKLDELKDANLFSPAEMLSPLGVSRDDSSRTAMSVKQSKHIIPVKKSSPVLISNGSEQTIHHHLTKDYVVTAKQDGVVLEVNEATGMVVLGYKDGTHEAFDTSDRMVKNGAGGFYLASKLDLKMKQGQKFKQHDVVAAEDAFFSDSVYQGNKFNIGSLQKIAIMGGYYTYEDSTAITKKLSRDMASDIIMVKEVVLGSNANVEGLVKKGQQISVGDELLRFETSFQDDSINDLLRSIGDDLKEGIQSLGKRPITSKYTGEIADVKVYSTVDIEELSPSLQKVVKDYHGQIKKKEAILNKYDKSDDPYKMGLMMTEPTSKIESIDGKVKGNIVGEGVLIQIFIKYEDTMGVGDKLAKIIGQDKFL